MAVTLTIGTTAAAATAAAIGAGALGLGALGAVALAGRRRRGGRRRRFRGKRQAEDEMELSFALKKAQFSGDKKQFSAKLDEAAVLAEILAADEEELCGRRLVCELAQQEAVEGNTDMAEILRFVREGDPVTPGTGGLSPHSPLLQPFRRAAKLGAEGVVCSEVFPQCSDASMVAARNILA